MEPASVEESGVNGGESKAKGCGRERDASAREAQGSKEGEAPRRSGERMRSPQKRQERTPMVRPPMDRTRARAFASPSLTACV